MAKGRRNAKPASQSEPPQQPASQSEPPQQPVPHSRPPQEQVPKLIFVIALIIAGCLVILAILAALSDVPNFVRSLQGPVVVVLLVVSVLAALASAQVVRWKHIGGTNWRDPKVLSTLLITLFGALGLVSTFTGLLGTPGTSSTATNRIETTVSAGGGSGTPDPHAEITRQTGSWSLEGFLDAVRHRELSIVKLYLKTGMHATTLSDDDTSALLYGLQDGENGDPVALLKVFQRDGFKLGDNLVDNKILLDPAYESGRFEFNTPLAPKGFTLGYDPGQFVGPLMLWMVIKMTAAYATTRNLDQDFEVLKYLMAQGAECTITRSYLTYNRKYLTGTDPFTQVYPLIKNCKA